ncbi:MAG: arsenate reductase ArsC [Pseudomonadota bacterium]
MTPYTVLVLCTGNSARSIMGEALFNIEGAPVFRAFSAGSQPVGRVNPFALQQLIAAGGPVDEVLGSYRSKSWSEFTGEGAPTIDFVITVCDNAAGESCPIFPGPATRIHWGLPDPAAVKGSDAEIAEAFAGVYATLRERIVALREFALTLPDREQLVARMHLWERACSR